MYKGKMKNKNDFKINDNLWLETLIDWFKHSEITIRRNETDEEYKERISEYVKNRYNVESNSETCDSYIIKY